MMTSRHEHILSGESKRPAAAAPARMPLLAVLVAVTLTCLNGCAAVTNPVADGIPVHRLPEEVKGRPREVEIPIPLTALRQPPPDSYRLDVGDVLGVWIEGVLGNRDQPPPVSTPQLSMSNLPPSIGFPIPVRDDGTISVPFIEPLNVKGMTTNEVQEALRKAYTVTKKILQPDRERILVDVQRPRLYHVLVIRQDSGGLTIGSNGVIGNTKRGTGFQLDLPAYENDVLNALARTGGFPGLDAKDEVVIERASGARNAVPQHVMIDNIDGGARSYPGWGGGEQLRVPLRQRREQPLPFKPADVILNTGDVLYIDSRDTEVYYTGGILPPQQFILPRDLDIDVVEAIAIARGPLVSGGFSNQFGTGVSVQSGLGAPSPSLVTILRKLPNGEQITIKVDLNKALRDPRERVLIQPKDFIFLQETMDEAITRYWTNIFRINFFATILDRQDATATTTIVAP